MLPSNFPKSCVNVSSHQPCTRVPYVYYSLLFLLIDLWKFLTYDMSPLLSICINSKYLLPLSSLPSYALTIVFWWTDSVRSFFKHITGYFSSSLFFLPTLLFLPLLILLQSFWRSINFISLFKEPAVAFAEFLCCMFVSISLVLLLSLLPSIKLNLHFFSNFLGCSHE